MKKNAAFTLIETLIAICVFWIGILVVLNWLGKTLWNQDKAKVQIQASFLAREWIELMFNLRDANYRKKSPWNCIFTKFENQGLIKLDKNEDEDKKTICKDYFENNKILKVWIDNWDNYIFKDSKTDLSTDFDTNFNNFQIYYHTNNDKNAFYYNHEWEDSEKTWFARYIKIQSVLEDWNSVWDDNLLKVESHVLYKKWALTWDIIMETFMWNYEF